MNKLIGSFALLWIAGAIALAIGWVLNVIAIFHMLEGPITALFIARIVGVFAAPLGGVLGYF